MMRVLRSGSGSSVERQHAVDDPVAQRRHPGAAPRSASTAPRRQVGRHVGEAVGAGQVVLAAGHLPGVERQAGVLERMWGRLPSGVSISPSTVAAPARLHLGPVRVPCSVS